MKLVDISHTIDKDTPIYPGDYKISLSKIKNLEADGYNAYLLQTGLHTGTHIDIPMHLTHDQRTVVDFSVDHFIGKGVLLDVRGEDLITMKKAYESMVSKGSVVLLYTGFDKHYAEELYFTKHPRVEEALADFLVSREIKIIGMDMPSPDHIPFTLHKAFLAKGIFVLENLTNLQSLAHATHFEVLALPLKICAEASPVRAVCKI